jgi:His-Xaa-Ser system protein HxsD
MIGHQLSFDATAYSADAIQRAAYRFSDRLSLDLKRVNGDFACTLLIKDELQEQAEEIAADFWNEALDQTLRERIRAETEGVRNLILALAFSNTGLTEPSE